MLRFPFIFVADARNVSDPIHRTCAKSSTVLPDSNMIRRISPLFASLLLLFCLALHFTNATLFADTILPGQSLYTSDSVVSAERRFGLGFFSPENSTKHYVVIYKFTYWYVSNDDIVWVANREHPFPNSSVILTFNSDGNLVISDGRSLHVLTNTSGGNDTYAKLLDTGWSLITSGKSDEDPAPGLFSLQYLGSRKEVILIKGSEQYWSSPLIDHLADIFVIDGDYFTWPISNYTNEIRRIRFDISGNLLLQTLMRGSDWFSFCLNYNNNINCTATDTIRPGQSLSTSETTVSANGRYELGFFSRIDSREYYYMGIRYYNVSGANVVWVANREDPFLNSSAVLTLDPDGNLVISDGKLLHVLTNTTSDAKTGWSLTSWKSDEDPSLGLFSLQYLGSRKELILRKGSEPHWTSPIIGKLADIFVIDGENITFTKKYPSEFGRVALQITGELQLQSICDETANKPCDCLSGFKPYAQGYTNSTNGTVTDTGFKNMKDIGNNQLRKIIIPTASIAVLVTLGLFVYYVTRRKLRRKGE
ncbi:hypothetical protein FH972_020254 [Carpinus fangiana]|uniref:Bulb-type lectin domain-containing protein n=1 Tax=Carpinus fangiana TaxID=176857 RepID=A0A5N6RU78_9ROSI|nr:hypothetical protein FH972_020254 [Carpinus fangiana]